VTGVQTWCSSDLHDGAALSATALLITPLGAVMALRLREKIPLQVYLWSFLPAMTCVIVASGGANVAKEYGDPGLWLVWAGVAAFAVFAVFEFLRLRRH